MLEQAVYAGRNHAFSLAVTVIVLLATSTPARAADVARVPLGDTINALVVGSDGGAWLSIARERDAAIGRIAPGGGLVANTPVTVPLSGASALGRDGQAWFVTAEDDVLVRADGAGALSQVKLGTGAAGEF